MLNARIQFNFSVSMIIVSYEQNSNWFQNLIILKSLGINEKSSIFAALF